MQWLLLQHLADFCSGTFPDATEIDVDNSLPVRGAKTGRGNQIAANASVVDSIVNSTKFACGLRDRVLDRFFICNIELQRKHFNVWKVVLDFSRGLLDRCRVQVTDGQSSCSMLCKRERCRLSDSWSESSAYLQQRPPKTYSPDAAPVINPTPFNSDVIV